jgi:hypothetical protein
LGTSFQVNTEWGELLKFFGTEASGHEKDEEVSLFPFILEKEEHVGFLPANSPIRFLLDGHAYLVSKVQSLVTIWEKFLNNAAPDAQASKEFVDTADEIVKAYREHIATEENTVYKLANDTLTPAERMVILERIYQRHDNEVSMPMPAFDRPTFSNGLQVLPLDYTDATSSGSLVDDSEEQEEEKPEEQKRIKP